MFIVTSVAVLGVAAAVARTCKKRLFTSINEFEGVQFCTTPEHVESEQTRYSAAPPLIETLTVHPGSVPVIKKIFEVVRALAVSPL
jgi:hypothetical protein